MKKFQKVPPSSDVKLVTILRHERANMIDIY